MVSKILECKSIIGGKQIQILNTTMDISVTWDADLIKTESGANIEIKIKEINGYISYNTIKKEEDVQLNGIQHIILHKVNFHTNDKWTLLHKKETNGLQPETAIIDFDNLKATIIY